METRESKSVTLRCYAYERRDGKVYAECVDLDIAVVRDNMREAVNALNDAVAGYVKTAASQGWYDELVPRPSPLKNRVHYLILSFLWRLADEILEQSRLKVYSREVTQDPIEHQPVLA